MFIKLLCINTASFDDLYAENQFTIKEGDIIGAIVDRQGIYLEYKSNCYSLPYRFEDIEKSFISAFDEETYNKVYRKANNCKMYCEDGTIFELGDATIKMKF